MLCPSELFMVAMVLSNLPSQYATAWVKVYSESWEGGKIYGNSYKFYNVTHVIVVVVGRVDGLVGVGRAVGGGSQLCGLWKKEKKVYIRCGDIILDTCLLPKSKRRERRKWAPSLSGPMLPTD